MGAAPRVHLHVCRDCIRWRAQIVPFNLGFQWFQAIRNIWKTRDGGISPNSAFAAYGNAELHLSQSAAQHEFITIFTVFLCSLMIFQRGARDIVFDDARGIAPQALALSSVSVDPVRVCRPSLQALSLAIRTRAPVAPAASPFCLSNLHL